MAKNDFYGGRCKELPLFFHSDPAVTAVQIGGLGRLQWAAERVGKTPPLAAKGDSCLTRLEYALAHGRDTIAASQFIAIRPITMKPARSSLPVLILAAALVGGCNTNPAVGSGATAQKAVPETPNVLQVSDVSIPPGAKLDAENSLIIGTGDRWVGRIVLKTDLAPVQVFNHIYSGMPGHGWSLVTAVQAKVSNMTYLRGERVASLLIEPAMSGSLVSITVSARQGQDAPVRPAAK